MPATCQAPFMRLVAVAVVATACATVPSTQSWTDSPHGSPYLLTAAEISRVRVTSAFEAVERLKPNFLLGLRGESVRAVYLNGARMLGGLENLRMIDASAVKQIVFLNSIDATTRFGSGNRAGVLLVNTFPAPRW